MDSTTTLKYLSFVRGLISEYADTADQTVVCKVAGVNKDGTYDLYVMPDDKNRITSIVNSSPYLYKIGDMVYLFKVDNSIARSFIIGGTQAVLAMTDTSATETGSGSSSSGTTAGETTVSYALSAGTARTVKYTQEVVGDNLVTTVGTCFTTLPLQGEANTVSYSIVANGLETTHPDNAIPTANAVYSFASQGKSVMANEAVASSPYSLLGTNTTINGNQVSLAGKANANLTIESDGSTTVAATYFNGQFIGDLTGTADNANHVAFTINNDATNVAFNVSDVTQNLPLQEENAAGSLGIVTDKIEANHSDNSIPTSNAVFNFASNGKTILVTDVNAGSSYLMGSSTDTSGANASVYINSRIQMNASDKSITATLFHGTADVASNISYVVGGSGATVNVKVGNMDAGQTYTVNNVAVANYAKDTYVSTSSTNATNFVVNIGQSNFVSLPLQEENAASSLGIATNIDTNHTDDYIPTSKAVYDFASTGKSILVTEGTLSPVYLMGSNLATGNAAMYDSQGIWMNLGDNSITANVFHGNLNGTADIATNIAYTFSVTNADLSLSVGNGATITKTVNNVASANYAKDVAFTGGIVSNNFRLNVGDTPKYVDMPLQTETVVNAFSIINSTTKIEGHGSDDSFATTQAIIDYAGKANSIILSDINGVAANLAGIVGAPGATSLVYESNISLSNVALLDSAGKLLMAEVPDAIVGQLLYSGTINSSAVGITNQNFRDKYKTTATTITMTPNGANDYIGAYFIATAGGTIAASGSFPAISYETGDWILSNGSEGYTKIDNTDAVKTVTVKKLDGSTISPTTGNIVVDPSAMGIADSLNSKLPIANFTGTNIVSNIGALYVQNATHANQAAIANSANAITNALNVVSGSTVLASYNGSAPVNLPAQEEVEADGAYTLQKVIPSTSTGSDTEIPTVNAVIQYAGKADHLVIQSPTTDTVNLLGVTSTGSQPVYEANVTLTRAGLLTAANVNAGTVSLKSHTHSVSTTQISTVGTINTVVKSVSISDGGVSLSSSSYNSSTRTLSLGVSYAKQALSVASVASITSGSVTVVTGVGSPNS